MVYADNWPNLPEDLLIYVAQRLSFLKELIKLTDVCKSWKSANESHEPWWLPTRCPLLILAEGVAPGAILLYAEYDFNQEFSSPGYSLTNCNGCLWRLGYDMLKKNCGLMSTFLLTVKGNFYAVDNQRNAYLCFIDDDKERGGPRGIQIALSQTYSFEQKYLVEPLLGSGLFLLVCCSKADY